jgi:hypothetical protein
VNKFWSLEPEVAGELGRGSVLDASIHPPQVSRLEYRFTGWLGDELLETFPCFVVTQRLGAALVSKHLSGFCLDAVDVVASEVFKEMHPDRNLPDLRWLKVTGQAGRDDFGLSDDHSLVVSDAALRLLRAHTLSHCDFHEYGG